MSLSLWEKLLLDHNSFKDLKKGIIPLTITGNTATNPHSYVTGRCFGILTWKIKTLEQTQTCLSNLFIPRRIFLGELQETLFVSNYRHSTTLSSNVPLHFATKVLHQWGSILLRAPNRLAMTDDAHWLIPLPPKWVRLHVTYWNSPTKKKKTMEVSHKHTRISPCKSGRPSLMTQSVDILSTSPDLPLTTPWKLKITTGVRWTRCSSNTVTRIRKTHEHS